MTNNYLNADNWPETTYHPAPGEQYPLPVAGCLPRVGAFFIDGLLLGVILFALSLIFPSYFYRLGPNGRWIGFAVSVGYFAYFTSQWGKGQTVGKRVTKIQVMDEQGHLLPIRRAVVRSAALCLIYLLNRWQHPIFIGATGLMFVGSVIVLGGVLTELYSLIFNGTTRQGPHDLLARSYVIPTKRDPYSAYKAEKAPGYHRVVLGVILLVVGVISVLMLTGRPASSEHLVDLMQAINEDSRFVATGVSRSTDGQHLSITVWYLDQLPADNGRALSYDVATIVASEYRGAKFLQTVRVTIFQAIDLGLTSRWKGVSWNYNLSG